ncbi:Wzz/FepE/Etk N-terminal domain-containing protein [Flavobacterium eburneipallidum]|uniref:Wzz/FepE/Etk N-terminal domain-containing protein n=1 Tax=Flavobacterium eburneipallidum TaxID=3003263 RepID=UPI002482EBA1|nr:Wzz/FepE/Etk N-terminal domain-containing protein [Flavobacterium eburneipallidum]
MENNSPTNKEQISLKEIIEIVKEWYKNMLLKWKTILCVGIIGGLLGLTYSFIKKPIYTASLSFALESNKSGGGLSGALGLASSLGFDLGGSGGGIFEGSNLTELFKSRQMVENTLLMPVNLNGKTISLAEMYIQNEEWRENWKKKPKLVGLQFLPNTNRKNFTRSQDSIFGVIYDNLYKKGLQVGQKDKKVDIITIEVSSKNELFAKYFTEALAKQVGDFYIKTKSKKARINMSILERQTDSIRRELNNAIAGVAVATDNTFGLNPSLNVRRVPSARRQVDVQANTAILTELVKQTELAKVTLRKETPLIQIIDRPILPLKKEKTGKLLGLLFGGFLFGFLALLFLTLKNILKKIV